MERDNMSVLNNIKPSSIEGSWESLLKTRGSDLAVVNVGMASLMLTAI
jgi:hypothetical protein